jgi:hypothetical protein
VFIGDSPTGNPSDYDLLGQRVVERGLFSQPLDSPVRVEVAETVVTERGDLLAGQRHLGFVPQNTDLTGQEFMPELVGGRASENSLPGYKA